MMEAARTSEPFVNFYQTTRSYNPEDSHLRTHRRENLKSYLVMSLFGSALIATSVTVFTYLYNPRAYGLNRWEVMDRNENEC
jgi:hypothetical protein